MKHFQLLVLIVNVLGFYITNVTPQLQENPAPASNQQPAPPGPSDPPTAPLVDPNVAQYLNRRIQQVLSENPPRNPAELNLAAVFNQRRALLEAALIGENPQKDDDVVAERALENFRNFLQQYRDIERQLESAIDDVTNIERDRNVPVDKKYEALSVLTQLRDSPSIKAAERALRNYYHFREMLNNGGVKPQTPTTGLSPLTPPLTDEYRRYFEEILGILRKFYKDEDPKMQTILQQILKDPWQLKKLAVTLKELPEEDYDGDYFWDWFSFW